MNVNGGSAGFDNAAGGTVTSMFIYTGDATNEGGTANSGGIGDVTLTSGAFTNKTDGEVTGTVTNKGGAVVNANGGVIAKVANDAGSFDNQADGCVDTLTNSGIATNKGDIANVTNNGGTFTNSASGGAGMSPRSSTSRADRRPTSPARRSTRRGYGAGSFSNAGTITATVDNFAGTIARPVSSTLAKSATC